MAYGSAWPIAGEAPEAQGARGQALEQSEQGGQYGEGDNLANTVILVVPGADVQGSSRGYLTDFERVIIFLALSGFFTSFSTYVLGCIGE